MTWPLTSPVPDPLNQSPLPPPFLVVPQPGSRLADLLAQRDTALARAEEAAAQAKAVVEGIKAEVSAQLPRDEHGQIIPTVADIPAGPGWDALRMVWEQPWRVDAKRLKAEDLLTYVRWAKQSPGYWTLSKANRGRG